MAGDLLAQPFQVLVEPFAHFFVGVIGGESPRLGFDVRSLIRHLHAVPDFLLAFLELDGLSRVFAQRSGRRHEFALGGLGGQRPGSRGSLSSGDFVQEDPGFRQSPHSPPAVLDTVNINRHRLAGRRDGQLFADRAILIAADDHLARHQIQRLARLVHDHQAIDFVSLNGPIRGKGRLRIDRFRMLLAIDGPRVRSRLESSTRITASPAGLGIGGCVLHGGVLHGGDCHGSAACSQFDDFDRVSPQPFVERDEPVRILRRF